MFLYVLLLVAIMTILVTLSWNSRRAAKRAKKTKQRAQTPPSKASLFRIWLKSTDQIESFLQTWLFTLSEEEFNTLCQQVEKYCKSVGIELDWLLEASQPLKINQPLQDTMPEVIVAYLISRYKAAQVKDEAQIFKTYQALNKNPASNLDLTRKLFSKLVDNGLVTISLSNLLNDNPQKRQEYMISAIRETANSNPVEFNKALKTVVLL